MQYGEPDELGGASRWRGAIRSYVWLLVILVLVPFGLHLFTVQQRAAPPLQQFYMQVEAVLNPDAAGSA